MPTREALRTGPERGPGAFLLALLLWIPWASSAARAQPHDSFTPPPDQSGLTSFASTRTPGHLGFDAHLWLDYRLHGVEGRDLRVPGMPLRHQLQATAIAQLGLWSRGALAVHVPVVLHQKGDAPLDRAGFGNVALDGRLRVWGAGVRSDGTVRDGTAIALRAVVHVPGPSEPLYIRGETRLDLSATVDLELFRIMVGGAFTYRRFTWGEGTSPFGEQLRFDGGLRIPFQAVARAFPGKLQESLLVELGFGHFRSGAWDARHTPVEGRLGYRLAVSDFFATLSGGAAFNPALGNPDFRLLFAFGYALRKHDQDADGIPDRRDQCVHVPEDRDGFQDEDGCADDDNDGDQIVDEDDRCPLEPAEWGRDDDEDGCTDPA